MKIEKEFPGKDSFEVFLSYPTQELEDRIFMKRKQGDDSQNEMSEESSHPNSISRKIENLRNEALN